MGEELKQGAPMRRTAGGLSSGMPVYLADEADVAFMHKSIQLSKCQDALAESNKQLVESQAANSRLRAENGGLRAELEKANHALVRLSGEETLSVSAVVLLNMKSYRAELDKARRHIASLEEQYGKANSRLNSLCELARQHLGEQEWTLFIHMAFTDEPSAKNYATEQTNQRTGIAGLKAQNEDLVLMLEEQKQFAATVRGKVPKDLQDMTIPSAIAKLSSERESMREALEEIGRRAEQWTRK